MQVPGASWLLAGTDVASSCPGPAEPPGASAPVPGAARPRGVRLLCPAADPAPARSPPAHVTRAAPGHVGQGQQKPGPASHQGQRRLLLLPRHLPGEGCCLWDRCHCCWKRGWETARTSMPGLSPSAVSWEFRSPGALSMCSLVSRCKAASGFQFQPGPCPNSQGCHGCLGRQRLWLSLQPEPGASALAACRGAAQVSGCFSSQLPAGLVGGSWIPACTNP